MTMTLPQSEETRPTETETRDGARLLTDQEAFVAALPAGEPARLRELRTRARDRFAELGYPTTQHEEWRFTNLNPLAKAGFALAPESDLVTAGDLTKYAYEKTARLVFVNGRFSSALSEIGELPAGAIVTGLRDALAQHPDKVEPFLGQFARFEEHAFVALNTAFLDDGLFVYVPRGVVIERPINVVYLGAPEGDGTPGACFPRNLIVADENSQATVVEQYGTIGEGRFFTCPVTEVVAEPSAVIDHYKLQRESHDAFHMATLQIQQDRASNFASHSISWGGGIVRNDVNAVLAGEGADANINGLYMVEVEQLIDNHMRIEHKAPHCDSHELFKGILEGRSRAVFSGRIYVHPGAQKTDAKQTNRNLLLSDQALCNSHPQLEIFADDVKCTHGSTVGELDETAIFYLRSRGIGEVAARSLLTYAFAADIVRRIKVPAVRRDLEEFLFRRLPKGEIVRQAV